LLDVITLAFFVLVVGVSIHVERNPLILGLMSLGGIWAVFAFKLGLPIMVTLRTRNKPVNPRLYNLIILLICAATASGIVGAGFNTASIINSMTGYVINV